VSGPPGSGKTWLCEAIAETATEEGFRVGWGAGWRGSNVPPLWPWQQAVVPLGERSSKALFEAPPDPTSAEWFTRCVAVVDHLRDLTAEHPTVVVLDDAHHADEPSRLLAQFVARHARALPLVLVVAHEPTGDGASDLTGLERDATTITLGGLSPDDAVAVLTGRGVTGLTEADGAFVAAATGGLPGALHRLAGAASDAPGVVGALVTQLLADLPPDVALAAAHAAVLGPAPRFDELVALTASPGLGVAVDPPAMAAELERRGLARRPSPGGMAFGHDQVRTALVATLDPDVMVELRARVARLLAGGPRSLDRLRRRADHALAAASRSPHDARVAVEAVLDAAGALIDANVPIEAATLLAAAGTAHEAAGLGRPPAALLATWGQALLRSGRLAKAREQFRQAAHAAEEDEDATSLGLAALGLGGVWLAEERSPIERAHYLDLLRRARRQLPDGDDQRPLGLRLDARLAAEVAYETGGYERIEARVIEARELGDPLVLAETLSVYHHSMLGPSHRELRAAIADEMLSVAARADNTSGSLMALLWLTTDQFLAGSPQAERTLRELHERADAASADHAAYIATVMDVMLLQREGRLDDAERAAEAAFTVGLEVGDPDALAYYGGQVVALRWIQGRSAEVLELAAETEASPTITPLNQAFTASLASLAAAAGELDRARALLSRLRGHLGAIHESSAWLVTLFSIVEAAYPLGDVEIASEAAELIAPFADLPVIGSLGVSCMGSARRSLGLAAVIGGDLDTAIALLEAAVADDERLGNRPLAAMTQVDLARARADRDAAGDHEAALALLDTAIREAVAMDLEIPAQQWRDQRSALAAAGARSVATVAASGGGVVPSTTSGGVLSTGPSDEAEGTIARRGRNWVLRSGDREVTVPDLLGMTYLVKLLTNPGVEIAAGALVAESDTSATQALQRAADQPVLDQTALAAYRQRVAELEDDLAEAERHADTERAARARIELDAVVDELTRTTNRFGRARQFSSPNERARTAVQKAVRRALDQIEGESPSLGAALRRSVHTGRTCSYDPAPHAPTHWRVIGG
jgi:tetratricopeptide (TPR) repeat protein